MSGDGPPTPSRRPRYLRTHLERVLTNTLHETNLVLWSNQGSTGVSVEIPVSEAKAQLTDLLRRAERGENIVRAIVVAKARTYP